MIDNAYPAAPICIRPMGDQGILVEFGDRINTAIHERVLSFDAQLRASPFRGFTESVPAYASVYVGYDCLVTDLNTVVVAAKKILDTASSVPLSERRIAVQVCYDQPFAPDLIAVADQLGLSTEDVVRAHLGGDYRVFMYGFAPGYAYLGGVPSSLNLPRKSSPVRNVPAGSVLIAGRQCLVSTIPMPTGWWIIGRSPTQILSPHSDSPFLFDIGDHVRFTRIDGASHAPRPAAVIS